MIDSPRPLGASRPSRTRRGQQVGVVDHLVAAAEVGVLVAQRVEAVRAVGDDLRHAGLVERLHVLLGEGLEDVLVADPPRRVAGARLARPEDREVDAGPLQELRGRTPRSVRARSSNDAAHPTQYRYSGAVSPGSRMRTPSPSAQSARSDCGLAPRVGGALDVAQHRLGLGREAATRPSPGGGAGRRCGRRARSTPGRPATHAPQVTQSQTDSSGTAFGTSGVGAASRHRPRALHVGPSANTWSRSPMMSSLGDSDLAGGKRGAGVLAAAALGARERVEHLLPGEVGGGPGAEADVLLGRVVVVEAQRLQPAARAGPPEAHVERGGRDVQVLGDGR